MNSIDSGKGGIAVTGSVGVMEGVTGGGYVDVGNSVAVVVRGIVVSVDAEFAGAQLERISEITRIE